MSAYFSSGLKKLPLVFTVLTIILLPLVFSQNTLDPTLAPRFTFLGVMIGLIAVSLFAKKARLHLPNLIIPFIAFLIIEFISLSQAINVSEGFWTISRDGAMLLFMLLLIQVLRQTQSEKSIINAFILCNGVVGLYALYQLFSTDALVNPDLLYEVKSTMAHRNLLASALLLTMPFLVYKAWSSRRWNRWISLVLMAHSCFLIFILESRSSWLGLAVFVLSYLVWFLLQKIVALKGIAFWRWLGTAFFILSLTVFTALYFSKNPEGKGEELKSGMGFSEVSDKTFTIDERIMLWKGTLRMVWNESWLGVGANNWKIVFPSYGSDIWRARQGMVQFQRPHNDYLWVLSEIGILGLLTYFTCFVVVIFSGLRFIAKPEGEGEKKILVKLLLSGIAAYMVVAFFSFPRERIFHQIALYALFGFVIYITGSNRNTKSFSTRHFIWVALLGVVISYTGSEWWRGEILARKLNHQRATGSWKELLETYNETKNYHWYKMDATSVPLSFYSGLAHLNLEEYNRSLQEFSNANDQHPNNIHVINNLANVLYLKGNVDSALVYYHKALEVSPKYLDGALNLMAVYFNSGKVEEAYEVLRKYETAFLVEVGKHPTLPIYRKAILESLKTQVEQKEDVSLNMSYSDLESLHFESTEQGNDFENMLIERSRRINASNDTLQF